MRWIWKAIHKKQTGESNDIGVTLLEVIIGITITFLISLGVFQLIKIGYNTATRNASAASQNGLSSTFAGILHRDISQSDGIVISSASANTKKNQICSTWDPVADPNFTSVRPLLTAYVIHTATINYAEAAQLSIDANGVYTKRYTYHTLDRPDLSVGQLVEITGLNSDVANLDFNIPSTSGTLITSVDYANKTFTVNVQNAYNAFGRSSSTTNSALVTNVNSGVYTLDSAAGVGDGMTVLFPDGNTYITKNVNPDANTFELTVPTNSDPLNKTLTFTSTSNGLIQTDSFSGYEVRAAKQIGSGDPTSELWHVSCQSIGVPNLGASIRMRSNLPAIDTQSNSNCTDANGDVWTDWGCAIKCPQFNNDKMGADFVPQTSLCPTDTYISIGQRSFLATISTGLSAIGAITYSDATHIYLANQNNAASSVTVGMSVDFPLLSTLGRKMYVTAVDLTDPSGNANVSVSCIPAASGCPVLVENEQVVLAASVIVTCTTNPCTVTGNAITVNDPTMLRRGMYLNLGTNTSPDFGVIGELANNVGSQDVPFVKLPASSTFPLALQFFRPTGIQFWIPAVNATPKLREEKIFVTQGG